MAAANKNRNLPSWTDAGLQGGSFLLTIVQSAAQLAPVPYLQQAAGSALFIINTVAAVKNNKGDFDRLAQDAVTLVAVIWRAYERSNNKEEWPSRDLRDMILEFCSTLDSITEFAKERGSRKWMFRTFYSSNDRQRISEYRERLTSAVQTFQVATDLNVNEMVSELLQNQKKNHNELLQNQNKNQNELLQNQNKMMVRLEELHMPVGNSKPSRKEEWPEQRPNHERPYPPARWDDTSSGSANGHASRLPHTPMSFSNIQYSGISFGDGGVTVTNGAS
ncbi:hypothetical protein BJ912DRAFT_972966 [Pholiota molesta]|nr:hypothetical protein BJ912DRAFT_972966 [Pholiota molesta]